MTTPWNAGRPPEVHLTSGGASFGGIDNDALPLACETTWSGVGAELPHVRHFTLSSWVKIFGIVQNAVCHRDIVDGDAGKLFDLRWIFRIFF